jgi:hypothetical protein
LDINVKLDPESGRYGTDRINNIFNNPKKSINTDIADVIHPVEEVVEDSQSIAIFVMESGNVNSFN